MSFPHPEITDLNRHYWDGIAAGVLRCQACADCGHLWLPASAQCPACLSPRRAWRDTGGRGRLVSWVWYHRAYAPHLEGRTPYNVAIVALDEGPRLLTNIVNLADRSLLAEGARVRLCVTVEAGLPLATFELENG
ncbi:OB-fold domain-containing protein [Paralimibaculum aggregatum]|uniref:OB-fold domain-containing protein n=1 Tax=Paralimibaculum aggregatum TaxID=3036245 RepID=A0ABQ6LFJ0_9RHOB|nr:OB-fold domain-containing protein [Limibaculum sp. NKW23]GMG82096.1 OB-fold domain-containing protein [Limibaculum sp. NKW23]